LAEKKRSTQTRKGGEGDTTTSFWVVPCFRWKEKVLPDKREEVWNSITVEKSLSLNDTKEEGKEYRLMKRFTIETGSPRRRGSLSGGEIESQGRSEKGCQRLTRPQVRIAKD